MIVEDRGFSIVERIFTRAEMAQVLEALASIDVARTRAGARHVLRVPAVWQLAMDPRLIGLASFFVGPTPIAFRATLFDKSPTANWLVTWHQDTALPMREHVSLPHWGRWSMKAGVLYGHAPASALEQVIALRVHFDDSSDANGPLRVLPGTHTRGLLTDEEIAHAAGEIEPVECLAAAGSVVAMRPLTVHASSKSRTDEPRRVVHIEYASGLQLGPGIELATA
jgi:Phytanoyl-CoA dioxygenase (PhyH)